MVSFSNPLFNSDIPFTGISVNTWWIVNEMKFLIQQDFAATMSLVKGLTSDFVIVLVQSSLWSPLLQTQEELGQKSLQLGILLLKLEILR